MRVLIQPRPGASTQRGGDWLHLEETLEPLRALGVQADLSTAFDADLSGYDVCLIWHSGDSLPALQFYFNARRQNKCVALMPIYWSLARLWQANVQWNQHPANAYAEQIESLRRRAYIAQQTILMHGSDALLPNSNAEAARLVADLAVAPEKIRVVHNGVAAHYAQGNATRFREQFRAQIGTDDFLLCVAQIAPRKNQLNLLRALHDDARLLVLMGDREVEAYAQLCDQEAAARGRVVFLSRQSPQVVADAFAAARAHVLVSAYDIAPRVSMEAAIAGTPQVLTTECGMRDYFGDALWYADPDDLDGIRRAIDHAWRTPRAVELSERLQREYTWERAARELAAALEWTLTRPPTAYDAMPELLSAQQGLEEQVALFWAWLEANAAQARAMEQWAHELQRQLQAPSSLPRRFKEQLRR